MLSLRGIGRSTIDNRRVFHYTKKSSLDWLCRLTAGVTRWWAGRDSAILPEPTSSRANCLKTWRLPPVGCTLCWAAAWEVRGKRCYVIGLLDRHYPSPIE